MREFTRDYLLLGRAKPFRNVDESPRKLESERAQRYSRILLGNTGERQRGYIEQRDHVNKDLVLVKLKLSDNDMGCAGPDEVTAPLQLELISVFSDKESGQFDGNEYKQGWCTLFVCAEDADRTCDLLLPIVLKYPVKKGSFVMKKYARRRGGQQRVIELAAHC